jgi:hypothetical protein
MRRASLQFLDPAPSDSWLLADVLLRQEPDEEEDEDDEDDDNENEDKDDDNTDDGYSE